MILRQKTIFTLSLVVIMLALALSIMQAEPKSGICEVIMAGDLAKVKVMIKENPALIQAIPDSYSPNLRSDDMLLHIAVKAGKVEIAKFLLDSGADINSHDNTFHVSSFSSTWDGYVGLTPLHVAAQAGQVKMVKLLIARGANVNADNLDPKSPKSEYRLGLTPIFIPCMNGHTEVVKLLIAAGADVNTVDPYGRGALAVAAGNGRVEIVRMLIAAGAKVNGLGICVFIGGGIPLSSARNAEIAKILVEHGADINAKDQTGRTPLACLVRGNLDVVKFLVEKGADVNARDNDGCTPIVFSRTPDIANYLLSKGAVLSNAGERAFTPLHNAVRYHYKDMVKFWLSKGISANARDKTGRTPLHYAYDESIIKILLAHGGDINARDDEEKTPLYIAAGHMGDAAQLLIASGADVNIRDKQGATPLHYATASGADNNYPLLASLLIKAGANINAEDNDGWTPLHEAAYWANIDTDIVIRFLIDNGANINAICRKRQGYGFDAGTPLEIAEYEHNRKAAKYLRGYRAKL